MSKKAPVIETAFEPTGPHLVPGRFAHTARIEACLGSRQS
jgi:hypothetical protein